MYLVVCENNLGQTIEIGEYKTKEEAEKIVETTPNLAYSQGLRGFCVLEEKPGSRESLYSKAQKLVSDDRRKEYGPLEDSFGAIAKVWSGILKVKITPQQVALCMIGLKLIRESSKHKEDNIVDIYGYTLCLEKLVDETQNR